MSSKQRDEEEFAQQLKIFLWARSFFGSDEKVCQAANQYLEQQKRLGKPLGNNLHRSTLSDYITRYRPVSRYYYKIVCTLMVVTFQGLLCSALSTVDKNQKKRRNSKNANKILVAWPVERVTVKSGFYDPIQTIGSSIMVDSEGVLIGGLATLKAYQAQGKKFIDVIILDLNALKKGFPWEIHNTLADFKIPFVPAQQSAIGMALKKKPSKRQEDRIDLLEKAVLVLKNFEEGDPSFHSLGQALRDRINAWMAAVLNFSSEDEYLQAEKIYKHAPECLIFSVNRGEVPMRVAVSMLDEPGALEAFEQAQASANAYKVPKTRKKKECHDETLC